MKIVAIVQARMGSTRLPGKVMKELSGQTALARVLRRLQRSSSVQEMMVATSDGKADDIIVAECKRLDVRVFRGDEKDVLDRYYRAAQFSRAEIVVRITADCPLIDAAVTDRTVEKFLEARPDYASNALVRKYPRGLDTEVFTASALDRAWRDAREPYQRAHVTAFMYQNPDRFKILSVEGEKDYSALRWTLDTEDDLKFLHAVYSRFEGRDDFGWQDVVSLLEREPELAKINAHVEQKAVHEG